MSRILYSNRDDPRIFVYRDGNMEYGVTLNFAHRKAWVMMISWLILTIAPVFFIWLFQGGILAIALFVAFDMCFAVSIVIISIKGASRDLKLYPGFKGPRPKNRD